MACLNRITFHWTGGANVPSATDFQHYHYIIDSNGIIYNGVFTPKDNLDCKDGKYAQHTGGGNTGNIGIAFCGCYCLKNQSVRDTQYPLTRIQLERGFELGAKLSKQYKIPIDNIITHYEFGKKYPKTSSAGKIDITYMHPFPLIQADECGDFIRNKVKWYITKI